MGVATGDSLATFLWMFSLNKIEAQFVTSRVSLSLPLSYSYKQTHKKNFIFTVEVFHFLWTFDTLILINIILITLLFSTEGKISKTNARNGFTPFALFSIHICYCYNHTVCCIKNCFLDIFGHVAVLVIGFWLVGQLKLF